MLIESFLLDSIRSSNGNDDGILKYLFLLEKLDDIVNNNMLVCIVEKKISHIDERGTHVSPEMPKGYKFELFSV
ncbi:hypothetical protein [Pseudobutyrivibrio ruminis]|uniref:hypothetical protein n=1 Tax=Pseudobutyrivibrio ruminis TaxID=46206 RepID=UPI00166FEE2E|nr:hypothetical protein [Pseudobutyrivibrio ruminis]